MRSAPAHLTPGRMDCLHDALGEEPKPDVVRAAFAIAEHERRTLCPEAWYGFAKQVVQSHPLSDLLLEDPFTARLFARPRGYAADPAALDMVFFGREEGFADALCPSRIGRVVFDETIGSGTAEALRARRELLAREVDALAARHGLVDACAVGAGHLRESGLCEALPSGSVGRWLCLDEDPRALLEITAGCESHPAIEPVHAGVHALLRGRVQPGPVHFVYTAHALDALSPFEAAALVARLFDCLVPGGRLLVSSFATGNPDRGYLEAFADWWPVYRDPDAMRALAGRVPVHEVADMRVTRDDAGRLLYLSLDRRPALNGRPA